ncbi:MAG: hypothetical protein K1X71_08130 [Pirellulales bacterium]|nr:hypothetical protein [Pirellulales bacterium]
MLGDAASVEAAAEWHGEAGVLFEALLRCGGPGRAGFIAECPDRPGEYQVHDLFDHAPEYVLKRRKREGERKARGSASASDPTTDDGAKRRRTVADNGRQRRTVADGGGQRRTTADNGAPHAPAPSALPAPAPTPKTIKPAQSATRVADQADEAGKKEFIRSELEDLVSNILKSCGFAGGGNIFWHAAALLEAGAITGNDLAVACEATRHGAKENVPAYFRTCLDKRLKQRDVSYAELMKRVRCRGGWPKERPKTNGIGVSLGSIGRLDR